MSLIPNQIIDDNHVIGIIGDPGAYAIAYEVDNSTHKLKLVLKLFNKVGDKDAESRFYRENEILHDLSPHDRVIKPFSAVKVNGSNTYYLMEKADISLHRYHLNKGTLDITEISSLFL